eukprot:1800431-Pleurochrysis_carterae.AAC.12
MTVQPLDQAMSRHGRIVSTILWRRFGSVREVRFAFGSPGSAQNDRPIGLTLSFSLTVLDAPGGVAFESHRALPGAPASSLHAPARLPSSLSSNKRELQPASGSSRDINQTTGPSYQVQLSVVTVAPGHLQFSTLNTFKDHKRLKSLQARSWVQIQRLRSEQLQRLRMTMVNAHTWFKLR